MKVFVVGRQDYYANWIKDVELVKNLQEAQVVLFTGGEDVDPSFYGCKKHPSTWSNIERDLKEKKLFDNIRSDQLAIGCCRGGQWLCVMNGGLLVQDVRNHAIYGTHRITNGKKEYQITSTHHQMQYPYNLDSKDYDVLYWANGLSSGYYAGDKINSNIIREKGEPEIVLYHKNNKPKCLAIQGHPEMMEYEELHDMLNNLIQKYV